MFTDAEFYSFRIEALVDSTGSGPTEESGQRPDSSSSRCYFAL
jgi:hypothetical protein